MTTATIAETSVPNAINHDVPATAAAITKMHHPRSSRCPVVSRIGACGGAETGCFVWTTMV
ncbi:MAG: hypothetical protein R2692_01040 [Microbacterium sp.]